MGFGFQELIILCIVMPIYFLPAIIASSRSHHNSVSLFLANLFLGWTFIGWVFCLVWSFSNTKNDTTVINNSLNDESVADELEKLLKLKESGVLNEDEFNSQKQKILS